MPEDLISSPDLSGAQPQTPAPQAGNSISTPDLSGQATYQSPYAERNPSEPLKNFGEDISQFTSGIGALAALPVARGLEVARGKPLVRDTDLPELGNAAKGMGEYYWNEYGKPLLKADEGSKSPIETAGKYAPYLGKHFAKAPLSTAMDLLPVDKMITSPLEMAGKAMTKQLATQSAKLGKSLKTASGLPRWFEREHLPQWIQNIVADKETQKLVKTKLEEANQTMKEKMFRAKNIMDDAFEKVPKEMRPYLLATGEATDPNISHNLGNNPAVKNLLAKVRMFNRIQEHSLKIPEDITTRTKYGGMYLQAKEKLRQAKLTRLAEEYATASPLRKEAIDAQIKDMPQLTFADLRKPEHFNKLQRLKSAWDKHHAPPIYAAVAHSIHVKRALENLVHKPLGGLSANNRAARLAKEMSEKGLASPFEATSELPGFLQARLIAKIQKTKPTLAPRGFKLPKKLDTPFAKKLLKLHKQLEDMATTDVVTIRGAEHSHNIKDLTLMRTFETYRLLGIKDFMDKLKEMGKIERPGWVKMDLRDEFAQVIEKSPAQNMPNFRPDDFIYVPESVAKMIQDVIHGQPSDAGVWKKVHFLTNLRNRVAYTMNPIFGARLAIQTGAIEVLSWKTPKDILYSIASHIIAAHPRATEVIPNSMTLSHEVHMPIELITAGMSYKKAWAIADQVFQGVSYGVHNQQRRAAAISYILYSSKNAPPAIRQVIANMLNISSTLKLLEAAPYDTHLLKGLTSHMRKYYGDYSAMASNQTWRQLAKLFISVPNWLGHAGNMIRSLPLEHPIKIMLAGELARIAKQQLQPEDEPETFKKMGLIPYAKKGGHTLYTGGIEMNMFSAGLEMANSVSKVLFPEQSADELPRVPSGMSPLPAFLLESVGRIDAKTFKAFVEENPDLSPAVRGHKVGGNWRISKNYNKHMNEKGEEVKTSAPNLSLLFLENEFPSLMKPAQQLAARGKKTGKFYEPTRFTWFGHPARKKFKNQDAKQTPEEFWFSLLGIPMRRD